jgi:hypothetical protein
MSEVQPGEIHTIASISVRSFFARNKALKEAQAKDIFPAIDIPVVSAL